MTKVQVLIFTAVWPWTNHRTLLSPIYSAYFMNFEHIKSDNEPKHILSTPKWYLPSTIKSAQFLLVYTYCFNKNVSRFTTEILWEKRTETWEKSGALFSIDVSFYAKVECLYHNDYMLLHTLLWPFPNRGRENLPSPGKLIFIKVSRLDILAYFMVSWFKLVFFKDYTTYFLLKEYITCTM